MKSITRLERWLYDKGVIQPKAIMFLVVFLSLLVLGILSLAGCGSSAQYSVVCKASPAPPSYPKPNLSCPCDGGGKMVVVKKTFWGLKTYELTDCTNHVRVYKIKRIKGQD